VVLEYYDKLVCFIEIASFLNISESNLVDILQNAQISIENVEEFLPFIHRLLTRGYPNIVKECSIQGRLSLLFDKSIVFSLNRPKASNVSQMLMNLWSRGNSAIIVF
jgi:ankyrin repeat protein